VNTAVNHVAGASASPSRWARVLLVALHVPVVVLPAAFAIFGLSSDPAATATMVSAVVVALMVGGLQLRHSLAAARGGVPDGAGWSLLALVILVYLPVLWFGLANWVNAQIALVASGLMLVRGWPRVIVAVPLLVTTTVLVLPEWRAGLLSTGQFVYEMTGIVSFVAVVGVALYAAARLVKVLDELHATRTELAELAVGRERLRVSRDLHDLLGQSLSAIALKGELAARLLGSDTDAARREVVSLTAVARDALRGVRAVAHEAPTVSLRTEIDGAVTLLAAAGIHTQTQVDLPDLTPAAENVLAWAVREGVTNLLRHSTARTCSISGVREDGRLRLEIVNDGAGRAAGSDTGRDTGGGLAGLTTRVQALSGSVSATPTVDGRFRLLVEVPQEAP
jgi:two-component system, NarL family, sensor histidine kinase DesK